MKALPTFLALAAAGVLVLGVASPASAAGNSIDPGDSLYAITCDVTAYPDFSLMSVDSSTAVSVAIGVGEGSDDLCAGQAAYNALTGKSYYVRWLDEATDLGQIDVATGVSTDLGEFFEIDGEFVLPVDVNAIAIDANGLAYALDSERLFSLNLDTAEVTEIGPISDTDIYSFAYDAKTAKFYAVSSNNDLYEVDVTDGSLDYLDTVSFDTTWENNYTYSLQFDEAGTAWVEVDHIDDGYFASLWSFSLSDLSGTVYSGDFTDDPFYTESLLIIPGKAALAATGVDSSGAPLWAGAAALLALTGAGLIVARSRNRRRAA